MVFPLTPVLPHTAAMSQMVGVRSLVAVGAGVMVVAAVLATVLTGGSEAEVQQPAQLPEMGAACTQAAQVALDPLVTLPSGKYRAEMDGTEWVVRTSVDHKTKWADHWYDVTCVVVLPEVRVASVRSEPRT
jgi:hypothetical protein